MKRPYRRTNILSYPKAQLGIIGIMAVLAVAYSATNYWMVKSAIKRMADRIVELPPTEATFRNDVRILEQREDRTLTTQLVLFGVLSSFVVIASAAYLSHKIAGPIYGIRKYMRDVARGTIEPRTVRVRKADFFQELAEDFNELQRNRGILAPRPEEENAPTGQPPENAR